MKILAKFYNKRNPFCVDLYACGDTGEIYIGEMNGNVDIKLVITYWILSVEGNEGCTTMCADLIQKGD